MVRLKLEFDNCIIIRFQSVSQFHYGSIKTRVKGFDVYDNYDLSQFHYGSIKTPTFNSNGCPFLSCLNSTMVRLKLWERRCKNSKRFDRSQFHYGSIKTLFGYYDEYKTTSESQFHYGSIKTQSNLL